MINPLVKRVAALGREPVCSMSGIARLARYPTTTLLGSCYFLFAVKNTQEQEACA